MNPESTYYGTSGWSYPSGYGKWKGVFYPKRWSGDELAYYAERFPAVEVNSSFYRMPAEGVVRGWAERTPAAFRFAVKLFRKFTHPEFYAREENASPEITPDDVAHMRGVLDVLAEADKLGAVLAQYPEHFYRTPEHLASLVRTLDGFKGYPLAVELRHTSWDTPQLHEILGHFRAVRARIDEPFYRNLDIPALPHEEFTYWRFHGRNAEGWRKHNVAAERYDYLYNESEIFDISEIIERRGGSGKGNFLFFNNHPNAQAAANAVELAAQLKLTLPAAKLAHLAEQFPRLAKITGLPGGQLPLV
jgi:uncharacterized protein YecE (DUF72 family)